MAMIRRQIPVHPAVARSVRALHAQKVDQWLAFTQELEDAGLGALVDGRGPEEPRRGED